MACLWYAWPGFDTGHSTTNSGPQHVALEASPWDAGESNLAAIEKQHRRKANSCRGADPALAHHCRNLQGKPYKAGDAGVGSPDTVVQVSDTSQLHIIHHDGHRPDLGMPMCYACLKQVLGFLKGMTWRCLAAVTFRIRALSEINQRIYLNFPTRRHTKKNIASYCFSF